MATLPVPMTLIATVGFCFVFLCELQAFAAAALGPARSEHQSFIRVPSHAVNNIRNHIASTHPTMSFSSRCGLGHHALKSTHVKLANIRFGVETPRQTPALRRQVSLGATLDRHHNFDISPTKVEQLFNKIDELGIDVQQDIEEKFVRGSGAGGQKINKTASNVQMRHLPTGLQVNCQREREREKNRFLALRQLVEKIETAQSGGKTKADKALEKKRKQKARRKRRSGSAKKKTASADSTEEAPGDSEESDEGEEGPQDEHAGALS